jgi:hypothetical protein
MTRFPRRLLALLSVAGLAWALSAAGARAAAPEQWRALAREIAAPWPGLQKKEGWFPDYIYGGGKAFCLKSRCRAGLGNARYGESLLGYGLVMTGLREGNQPMIESGIKAINYIIAQPKLQSRLPTAFEGMAVAATHNLLRRRQPDNALFREAQSSWKDYMRRQPVITTIFRKPNTPRYQNHFLIEALEVLELIKSGVTSTVPNAILGGKRTEALRIAKFVLNQRVPAIDRRNNIDIQGVGTWVHSDPPDNALAYFGLSAGLYAHAVQVLGGSASSRVRKPILEAANAAVWVSGPDGDASYYGRSEEDSWANATLALGTEAAADTRGVRASQVPRYHAVTDRALARLRDAYGNGALGWWVTPSLKANLTAALKGVDGYAGAVAFTGLTLVALDWALDEMDTQQGSRPVGSIGADSNSAAVASQGESQLGVVRRGDVWFAVKRQASSKRKNDMRYDFGLVALKRRTGGGWTDVLRLRPVTSQRPDSVGPILRTAGDAGLPKGERLRARGATVTVTGGYRSRQRRWLRRGVRWTWKARSCGAQLSFPVQAGDRYEYSTFFVDDGSGPKLSGKVLSDERQRVSFSRAPVRVATGGGYVSGLDPKLLRARAVLQAGGSGVIRITTCGR